MQEIFLFLGKKLVKIVDAPEYVVTNDCFHQPVYITETNKQKFSDILVPKSDGIK